MAQSIVGMLTSYSAISQGDWLWQQSPQYHGRWGKMQLQAQAQQPDFLLLYQFDFPGPAAPLSRSQQLKQTLKQTLKPQPNPEVFDFSALTRGVPKERIIYLLREPPLAEVVDRNQFNYDAAAEHCGYVSGPDDYAPTPDYMPAIWYLNNTFRELDEMPPPEKILPCSWITSGINRTENHRKRLRFMEGLQQSGTPVDYYGRGLPSWAKSGGALDAKWYGMAPYYYNLAIENYADNDWYASEKLWDSLLAWCLPIYYGGSAADKLIPPESFLRLPSLDEKGIAYIQEVIASPDLWFERKEAIAEARRIILHKLNLMNWLSDFVEARS
jgi:Glycosyltransferase family 10 (fucosyltransferase) C-term